MSHLENAISEADKIESQLNVYCDSIQHIQKSIVNMGKKNTTIQVMGKNNHVLLDELENIIVRTRFRQSVLNSIFNILVSTRHSIQTANGTD